MDAPTTNDCVLNYMYRNFPRKDWTLDTYLLLAYWDGRGLEDLGRRRSRCRLRFIHD
jgi:hypothetical protein